VVWDPVLGEASSVAAKFGYRFTQHTGNCRSDCSSFSHRFLRGGPRRCGDVLSVAAMDDALFVVSALTKRFGGLVVTMICTLTVEREMHA